MSLWGCKYTLIRTKNRYISPAILNIHDILAKIISHQQPALEIIGGCTVAVNQHFGAIVKQNLS